MRLLSSFLVICVFMIASHSAFSQVPRGPRYNPPGGSRPYPGPRYPVPVPRPYPRPVPAPIPRYPRPIPVPRPVPVPALSCSWGDLYEQSWLIHRFALNSDCQQAVRDIYETGRFCDDSSMYDRLGNLITRYQWEIDCRRALRGY